VKNKTKIWENN